MVIKKVGLIYVATQGDFIGTGKTREAAIRDILTTIALPYIARQILLEKSKR